jgi:hypothetical protein
LSDGENPEPIRVLLVLAQQGFIKSKSGEKITRLVSKKIGGPRQIRSVGPSPIKVKRAVSRG